MTSYDTFTTLKVPRVISRIVTKFLCHLSHNNFLFLFTCTCYYFSDLNKGICVHTILGKNTSQCLLCFPLLKGRCLMACPEWTYYDQLGILPHKRHVFLLITMGLYIEGYFQTFPFQVSKGSINQAEDGKLWHSITEVSFQRPGFGWSQGTGDYPSSNPS